MLVIEKKKDKLPTNIFLVHNKMSRELVLAQYL